MSDFFFARLIFFWIDISDLRRLSISRAESFLLVVIECPSAFLIGVAECAHPVEGRLSNEAAKFFEFFFGFAGEADDE